MSKDKKRSRNKPSKQKNELHAQPWVTIQSGIRIILIASLGMLGLTAIQAVPAPGWAEGLLWSTFFGTLIWTLFFGMIFVNRFFQR